MGKFLPPIPDDAQPTGERGDFITRLIAVIIDSLVMIPIFIVVVIPIVLSFFVTGSAKGLLIGLSVLLCLVLMLGYVYFMLRCISKHGATIGKKKMKLRIVPEDNPYGRLTIMQALIRQICHIANFGVGYLLVFGVERKAVHDMITKTIVIKVDR